MVLNRVAVEFGMGTSLRKEDYTGACRRALKDALWRNSLTMAEAFGFEKSAMIVDVVVAVQKPNEVDTAALKDVLPYGSSRFSVTHGGLDIPKPKGGKTIMANCTVIVSFEMERRS